MAAPKISDDDVSGFSKSVLKLPRALFFLSTHVPESVAQDLADIGIEVVFAKTEEEVFAELGRPDCFAIFTNLKKFPGALSFLRRGDSKVNCFWVAVESKLSTGQSAALYNLGFADILTYPVHPINYRNRARQFLKRFVEHYGMPEDVILPAGISRPQIARPSGRSGGNSESFNPVHTVHDLSEISDQKRNQSRPVSTESLKNEPIWLSGHKGVFGSHQTDVGRLRYFDEAVTQLATLPKLFESIPSREHRTKLLNEAVQRKNQAIVWIKKQAWKGDFEVHQSGDVSAEILLSPRKGAERVDLEVLLASFDTDRLFVGVSLRRARVFFSTFITDIIVEGRSLRLKVPQEMFHTQRRNHFRLRWETPGDFKVAVTFVSQDSARPFVLADLSASGCQLCVQENEVRRFEIGKILPGLTFSIYGRRIKCAAVVRWRGKGRVGLQFLYLSRDEEEGLQLFVLEESLSYLNEYVHPAR